MACQQTPTETQFATITSNSVSVTVSNSVTTLPDRTTFSVSPCPPTVPLPSGTVTGPLPAPCVPSTVPVVIPGGVSTVQVPVTVTVPVTQVNPTKTLFAPCRNDPPPPAAPVTSIISVVTPDPLTITQQISSTLAGGSVVVNTVVVTSTRAPTSVSVPVPVATSGQQNGGQSSSKNFGPIIGGAVGGFAGLIAIIYLIRFLLRRRSRWDDIFEKEDDHVIESSVRNYRDSARRLDLEVEPKPYPYGLVGQASPPLSPNDPSRPLSTMASFDPTMMVNSTGPSGYGDHSRQLPLTQTLLPAGAYVPGQPSPMPSRPSTSGSQIPLQGFNPMQSFSPPPSQGRPPSAQPEFGVGPSHGYSQTGFSSQHPNSFPMQAGYYPGTNAAVYGDNRPGSASAASGSQSQGEEQLRQMQLANPSMDTPLIPQTSMDQKGVGQQRRMSSAPVIVHQGSEQVGLEPQATQTSSRIPEEHHPPPPAYSE